MVLTIRDEKKFGLVRKSVADAAVISGVVTERDAIALSWVISQGVMSVDQIFRAVYSGGGTASSRYAYKRVQFLESSGYLASVNAGHKKERFLKATKRAQKLLFLKGLPDITQTLHIPTISEIPHAEILTEIRIAILKSGKHAGGLWWRSEGSLLEDEAFPKTRFQDLLPDALWVTKSGTRVAIEFERTRKGITRVRKKVEGLERELNRADRSFDLVLWVSVDGAYRDLQKALSTRPSQKLRTVNEFLQELKGE